jgi:hypothetical protein
VDGRMKGCSKFLLLACRIANPSFWGAVTKATTTVQYDQDLMTITKKNLKYISNNTGLSLPLFFPVYRRQSPP